MPDKAFEIGLFTLDEAHRVAVRPDARTVGEPLGFNLAEAHGLPIRTGGARPMIEALRQHWNRIGYDPGKWK